MPLIFSYSAALRGTQPTTSQETTHILFMTVISWKSFGEGIPEDVDGWTVCQAEKHPKKYHEEVVQLRVVSKDRPAELESLCCCMIAVWPYLSGDTAPLSIKLIIIPTSWSCCEGEMTERLQST